MRRSFRWSIAAGSGLLVGTGIYLSTEVTDLAIGTAIVYVLAADLSLRANETLQAHPNWEDTPVDTYWMLGLLFLIGLPLSFFQRALELSGTVGELALLLFVSGIALGGMAAGIGLTVEGLDVEGQSSATEMERHDANEHGCDADGENATENARR